MPTHQPRHPGTQGLFLIKLAVLLPFLIEPVSYGQETKLSDLVEKRLAQCAQFETDETGSSLFVWAPTGSLQMSDRAFLPAQCSKASIPSERPAVLLAETYTFRHEQHDFVLSLTILASNEAAKRLAATEQTLNMLPVDDRLQWHGKNIGQLSFARHVRGLGELPLYEVTFIRGNILVRVAPTDVQLAEQETSIGTQLLQLAAQTDAYFAVPPPRTRERPSPPGEQDLTISLGLSEAARTGKRYSLDWRKDSPSGTPIEVRLYATGCDIDRIKGTVAYTE